MFICGLHPYTSHVNDTHLGCNSTFTQRRRVILIFATCLGGWKRTKATRASEDLHVSTLGVRGRKGCPSKEEIILILRKLYSS